MIMKIGGVRPFTAEDIPAVADLWQRSFRHTDRPASEELRRYFRQIFFESPWVDPDLPCLVYEAERHAVIGFLGVLPRPMVFRGRPIRMAVATQLMVDPTRRRGFAALDLFRTFLAGQQDLSYSDGANEHAHAIWERAGGDTARLYCLEWTRSLRPAQSINRRIRSHKRLEALAWAAKPACVAFDALATRISHSPLRLPPPPATLRQEDLTAKGLFAALAEIQPAPALAPRYDVRSLEWLLDRAAEARSLGELRGALVRDETDELAGWYLYYAKGGQAAHVLQIGAEPGAFSSVLDCLVHDAWRTGAIAVSGQLDPRFLEKLHDKRCRLACLGAGVLVHARDPDISAAVHRGDAFLSRLEGEWWLRLGIDRRMDW